MSLNWNLSKIANHETLAWTKDGTMNPRTEALIWSTLALDMGEISAKNVDEFWHRLDLYQHAVGPLMENAQGPVYFTRDDVVAHTGLKVNVTTKSRSAWHTRLKNILLDRAISAQGRREREQQKAG